MRQREMVRKQDRMAKSFQISCRSYKYNKRLANKIHVSLRVWGTIQLKTPIGEGLNDGLSVPPLPIYLESNLSQIYNKCKLYICAICILFDTLRAQVSCTNAKHAYIIHRICNIIFLS
jgi:hypothetical protein